MATSQYSILREYQPYVSPYNLDLIKDVMVYKQGKVDVNRERISNQIDLLMGQTIAKPEAREYFENKMAGVLNRVNNMYRGADLSSEGVVRHIQGEISSVLDDTIINALAGTKAGQQMMDYIHQVQLNHPEQYSSANAFVALQPYYEWLEDGRAGSRLAPLQYTPYTDYNKELRDNMTALLKNHKGTTYQQPVLDDDGNPTGAMMTITRDSLTPQQAADLAMGGLSQNARMQMQIEARYMAASNPQAFSLAAARTYGMSLVAQQQDYINYINGEITGAASGSEERTMLENELRKAKSDLATMQENVRSLNENTYSPIVGAMMVVEGNFKQGAASMYAYDNSSMKIDKDPIYWARLQEERLARAQNIQLEIAKMNMLIREETLRWRMYNDEANRDFNARQKELDRQSREDIAVMRYRNSGGGRSGSQAGQAAMAAAGTAGTVTQGTINTEDINVNKVVNDEFRNVYTALATNSMGLRNRLTEGDLAAFNSWLNAERNNPASETRGMSDNELILKYIDDHGGLGSSIFTNITDSDARKEAVAMYEAAKKATTEMIPINERLSREQAEWDKVYEGIGSAIKNMGVSDQDIPAAAMGYVIDSFGTYSNPINAFRIGQKTGRLGEKIINVNNGGVNFEVAGYTVQELEDLQSRINSVRKGLRSAGIDDSAFFGNDFNIYNYTTFDEGSGYYHLGIDNNVPDVIKAIRSGYSGYGSFKVFWDRFKDWFGAGSFSALDKQAKNNILEIRKDYINQNAYPVITFDLGVNSSDPSYEEAQELKSIYATTSGNGLNDQYSLSLQRSSIKGDNGEVQYQITPVSKRTGRTLGSILVPASDFTKINVNAQDTQNIPVAKYDSGFRSMNFADDTNDVYARMLESRGYSSVYANVNSLLASYHDKGGILNHPDVDPEIIAVATQAADKILRNYNKFRIRVQGYDEGGVGFTVSLYGWDKNEKPKKLDYRDSPTTFYADSIDAELLLAPQVQLDIFLQSALDEEVAYMIANNVITIRPDGRLGRMLTQAGGQVNAGGNS